MSAHPITNVALVDDHTLVRSGLVGLVNRLGGYKVVMEAEDGREFTRILGNDPVVHIAIIDLNMPIMDGFATIAWLHRRRPDIKAIALTFDGRESAVIKAVRNGARGFLLKNMMPEQFRLALDCVRDTGYYESEDGYNANVDRMTPYERQQGKVLDAITDRELEFIKLACAPEEWTYEEMADRMNITPNTIDAHRKHVFDRFGIKSKAGLVIFAYRWGIVKVVQG